MAGKVIHVSDEIHTKLRCFCAEKRIPMREWIEGLLESLLDAEEAEREKCDRIVESLGAGEAAERGQETGECGAARSIVGKKRFPEMLPEVEADADLWSRPPFWLSKNRVG